METKQITGETLLKIGFPEGKQIGIALDLIHAQYSDKDTDAIISEFTEVLAKPKPFLNHPILGEMAKSLLPEEDKIIPLRDKPLPYKIYGEEGIDKGAEFKRGVEQAIPDVFKANFDATCFCDRQ